MIPGALNTMMMGGRVPKIAPAIRSLNTYATFVSGSVGLPVYVVGDLLLILCKRKLTSLAGGTVDAPGGGWNLIQFTTDSMECVYFKIAGNDGASVAMTPNGMECARMYSISGVNPSHPINSISADPVQVAGTNLIVPAINTTVDHCLVFCADVGFQDANSITAVFYNNADNAVYGTESMDYSSNAGDGVQHANMWYIQENEGATKEIKIVRSASILHKGYQIAIEPA